MDLVDAFFDHAVALVGPPQPSTTEQIDFRRAVSAAYYAIFHLLTMTASEHWATAADRNRFARLFDYDNSMVWSYTEAENAITRAQTLYIRWNTVRNTPLAQSYLLDMMGGR
jgi:hypothetical protein